MDTSKDMDSIQQLNNIFSTGNCQIEVKFGTMVFGSPIVIITSNASPRQIALSTGEVAEPYEEFVSEHFNTTVDDCHRRIERARSSVPDEIKDMVEELSEKTKQQ